MLKFICALIVYLIVLTTTGKVLAATVPVPTAELVPRTANSIPWNAADRQLLPQHLNQFGYSEEEYFISGTANVYSWEQAGPAIVKTPNAPYTNRILVRRPIDSTKFSGVVVFEVLNATQSWDLTSMWAQLWEKILRDGDIYIGVTSRPIAVDNLKIYNPERYSRLSWSNPLPQSQRNPNPPLFITPSNPADEDGLVWDIISQTGALLKSRTPGNPFKGYKVDKVYAIGHSQSAMILTTYINAIQQNAVLSNGKPVFDGFLLYTGSVARSINQDSPPIALNDPRQMTINCSVPVIRMLSSWDFNAGAPGDLATRREDSDNINDRFRHYEIAGSAHKSPVMQFYRSGYEEIGTVRQNASREALKLKRQATLPGTNLNTIPSQYLTAAALVNLDAWVRKGIAPPRASRLEVDAAGKLVYDQYGNAMGGLRLPHIDIPTGTYYVTSANPTDGYFVTFDKDLLKRLYPTHRDYVDMVVAQVELMVRERWLLPLDGERIKYEAAMAPVPE